MALAPEQRRILHKIKAIGAQVGATPKEVKAAIQTGLVESNLRNLPGGDADSAGWRQERAGLYRDPTNLDASIRRFFEETRGVRGKYARAGDLAAAVQRPAAQYRGRYQAVSSRADQLLGGGGAPSSTTQSARPDVEPTVGAAPGGPTRGDLLTQYVALRGRPGALAALGAGLGDLEKAPAALLPTATPTRTASPRPAFHGTFKITGPNPSRLRPQLVAFARRVAGEYGKPLTGSDGTGHSYRTATGGVSQHSSGQATDIPASGAELTRMGRAALIAAGMPRSEAMRQTGGLFNVNGHQIIFHDRKRVSGSPHDDHLHISAR